MITKEQFATEYEKRLRAGGYGWVDDAAKLARFMAALRGTIGGTGRYGTWAHDGPITRQTWRALGMPLPSEADAAAGLGAAFGQQISPAATGL
jgi:hypothetical protein